MEGRAGVAVTRAPKQTVLVTLVCLHCAFRASGQSVEATGLGMLAHVLHAHPGSDAIGQ